MKGSILIPVPTPIYWILVIAGALFLSGWFIRNFIIAIRDKDSEALSDFWQSVKKFGFWTIVCVGLWGLLMVTR